MPTEPESIVAQFSIPQAAKLLKVTEKTVRNYIDRGVLSAKKWNGAWRIEDGKIKEIFYKKYGKKIENHVMETLQIDRTIQVLRQEYDELLRRSGRLDVAESLARELRLEIKASGERLAQLEASSASGWTEARRSKEDAQRLTQELKEAQARERESRMEADWLRRELARVREENEGMRLEIEHLRKSAIEACVQSQSKEEALEACREALQTLEARYRRNGFLD